MLSAVLYKCIVLIVRGIAIPLIPSYTSYSHWNYLLFPLPLTLLRGHNVSKIFKLLKNQTDYYSSNSICRQVSKCEVSKIPLLWEAVAIEWSTAVTMFGGSLVKNV